MENKNYAIYKGLRYLCTREASSAIVAVAKATTRKIIKPKGDEKPDLEYLDNDTVISNKSNITYRVEASYAGDQGTTKV